MITPSDGGHLDPEDPGVLDPADAALLADLAELLQPSAPTAEVLAAAQGVFTWRTVDAELAALTYDSLLDDAPATTRGGSQPRILTFEADGLTVEVELTETPQGRRLLGQLVPAQAAGLELRSRGEVVETGRADEMGRFALDLPATPTPVSVRCTLTSGAVVESASVLV